jgi:hypothetical protein
VKRKAVRFEPETLLLGNFGLQALDFGVKKLHHPTAIQTSKMVVMLAFFEFEDRTTGIDIRTTQQPGLFELQQHPVNRTEPH